MKDIPHSLIRLKGKSGLIGVTVVFVVSLFPLGSFVYFHSPHFWTQTESSLSIILLIGTVLLVLSEGHHLELWARSDGQIPNRLSDLGHRAGGLLYFVAIGYMVLGAGNFPALHLLIYASAAIFYTNRLLLLYPSNAGESQSQKDWKRFTLLFLVELLIFGILLWFFYFRGA